MTFRLLGMTEEERLAFEEASGIKTEAAKLIVEASVAETERMMQQTVRELQEVIGPHGSVSRLQAGSMRIATGLGIGVFEDGILKTTITALGDLFAGSDINEPATTTFCVFVNEQDYNGEIMRAGDILIGDNSTAVGNVKYDSLEGQLQFRSGTTVKAYMDTDGSIKAGSGNVTIDENGIILIGGAYPATSYMTWKLSTGETMGFVDGWYYQAGLESGMEIIGQAKDNTYNGSVFIVANDHSGNNEATLKVQENNISAVIGITTAGAVNTRGFSIQSFVTSTNGENTVLYLDTYSTGTPANGLGSAIAFRTENSVPAIETIGALTMAWADKTDGSEDGLFKLFLMRAGALVRPFEINSTQIIFNQDDDDLDFIVHDAGGNAILTIDANDGTIDMLGDTTVDGNLIVTGNSDLHWDGWQSASETWTRTANHTFTVSGDLTTKYRKGTKVRYKDGGAYEYGVIISSSHSGGTTTINLLVNTDYTMAAATITDKYYSYSENAEGFPTEFTRAVAWTNLSVGNGTLTSKVKMIGNLVMEHIELVWGSTTSISGSVSLDLAATMAGYGNSAVHVMLGQVNAVDDSAGTSYPSIARAASTTSAALRKQVASTTDLTLGNFSSTSPFTWTTSDVLTIKMDYWI